MCMLVVAVAVAVQYLATQFYDPSWRGGAYRVADMDPLMVVGMVLVVLIAYARKRHAAAALADPAAQVESLKANLVLYYAGGTLPGAALELDRFSVGRPTERRAVAVDRDRYDGAAPAGRDGPPALAQKVVMPPDSPPAPQGDGCIPFPAATGKG